MPEFEVKGPVKVSFSADGTAMVESSEPLTISPGLPITDIRVTILELVSIELVRDGEKRTIRGKYADGGTFEVHVDAEAGKFEASGAGVLSDMRDGADKSHTVLTYLPKVRHVHKKTH